MDEVRSQKLEIERRYSEVAAAFPSSIKQMLSLENLTVAFPGLNRSLVATRDVSLTIARGETLALVGESGSGKSVTSLAIMRLLPPQALVSGAIKLDGKNLLESPEAEMRQVRGAKIAIILQEPMTAL